VVVKFGLLPGVILSVAVFSGVAKDLPRNRLSESHPKFAPLPGYRV